MQVHKNPTPSAKLGWAGFTVLMNRYKDQSQDVTWQLSLSHKAHLYTYLIDNCFIVELQLNHCTRVGMRWLLQSTVGYSPTTKWTRVSEEVI